jgi:uncharacterized Zn finger protein
MAMPLIKCKMCGWVQGVVRTVVDTLPPNVAVCTCTRCGLDTVARIDTQVKQPMKNTTNIGRVR